MNNSAIAARTPARQNPLLWPASMVGVVLCLLVGAWMWLPSVKREERRALPNGQLQADARTAFAALNFLLAPETDPGLPTARPASCASNFAVGPVMSATFCCASNQSELQSEQITNVLTRS